MSAIFDFLSPILEFPSRVKDAFTDPVRRRHIIGRIAETWVPSAAILSLVAGWWALALAPAIVIGELAMYEFVLEPLGWTGHYWERSPRDGEVFINP